jgi:5'-nucleotidase
MQNRRTFLKQSAAIGGLLLTNSIPFKSLAGNNVERLTILHSNDTHSQLEPFASDAVKFANLGGVAGRATLINKIRIEEANVLLLDAGDFFQGTDYFDTYKGIPEIESMNLMRYDAITIGDHEFDGGIENLAEQLSNIKCPILVANYGFEGTSLEGKIKPYTTITKAGMKIGIIGIGIDLNGLVADPIAKRIKYLDPVKIANETALVLKQKENCDFIICLSHLGFENFFSKKVNDKKLAQETEHIDLVVGGHSHTFLDKPFIVKNKKKRDVLIVQAGWGGVKLGRIDYIFSDKKKILSANAQTVIIGK